MQKASSHPLHLAAGQMGSQILNLKSQTVPFDGSQMEGAPTHCMQSVSGLFHSPNRGSFHLSLAVLVHYRLPRSI